jgi:capsular polysaccharide biosynthesis protein
MSDQAWRVDEFEPDPPNTVAPSSALVTMHFLLTALRRRWKLWVSLGCVGMLLGLAWTYASPPKTTATVSVMLAHEPGTDPQQASSTDVSLLQTRTLAVEVVEELGLDMAPEDFQQSVTVLPASVQVLVLEVSGPDGAAAVARARALAHAYLSFRASQVRLQLRGLTDAYRGRIESLRAEGNDLVETYGETRASGSLDPQEATALLNEQAQLKTEIEGLKRSIEDAELKSTSVIDASYVLDQASAKPPPSAVRAALLASASGLIGGTALGMGFVLVTALTSNRLRRREDVALALDAPVRVSVGGRLPSPWRPWRRVRLSATALGLLVGALDREVARPTRSWPQLANTGTDRRQQARGAEPTRLALVTLEPDGVGELVVASLAVGLSAEGLDVFVVDLTASGGLQAELDRALGVRDGGDAGRRPAVHRPARVPSLERGPLDLPTSKATEAPSSGEWPLGWDQADVTLTLADMDPAIGVEHVRSWADRVAVLVSAGRSSAERLRTTGELIRSAGLHLLFAMMVGTDRTDESTGLPEVSHRGDPYVARRPT